MEDPQKILTMNKHQDIHLIVIKLSLDGIMINITNGVAFTVKKLILMIIKKKLIPKMFLLMAKE